MVITPRQFLDHVAIAYIEFYNDDKLSSERSAFEAARVFGNVDTVRDILNQQTIDEDWHVVASEFVDINETTELFFNSVIEESARAEVGQDVCSPKTTARHEPAGHPIVIDEQPSCQKSTKKAIETKQKRNVRKKSFLERLEDARNGARKGLPV